MPHAAYIPVTSCGVILTNVLHQYTLHPGCITDNATRSSAGLQTASCAAGNVTATSMSMMCGVVGAASMMMRQRQHPQTQMPAGCLLDANVGTTCCPAGLTVATMAGPEKR
jgi:hypothetical protein